MLHAEPTVPQTIVPMQGFDSLPGAASVAMDDRHVWHIFYGNTEQISAH